MFSSFQAVETAESAQTARESPNSPNIPTLKCMGKVLHERKCHNKKKSRARSGLKRSLHIKVTFSGVTHVLCAILDV